MKITAKKILSLVLAAMMIMSAVSVAIAAPKAGSLEIKTEIIKGNNGEWTVTDKVENGEAVKVRVSVGTDYPTNTGSILLCYEADFFESAYVEDVIQSIASNDEHSVISGAEVTAAFYSADGNPVKRLVSDGVVTQDDAQKYRFVRISYSFPISAGNTKLDADEWIAEFELKVKTNAPEKESTVKALDSALMTPDNPKGAINVPVGEEGGYVGDVVSLSEYEVDFTNVGATVNNFKKHKLVFNVNGGEAVEPMEVLTGDTVILPECEKEGYSFVYWLGDGFYEAGSQFVMPAKDVTLNAMWLVNSHTLKYYIGGEEFIFVVTEGSALPEPDLSDIEGLEILGWIDEKGNETELPAKMPNKNVSFTAIVKYNFDAEGGIAADFDGGIFGGNENEISFNATSKSFSAVSGGVEFDGENYKQIASSEIGFFKDGVLTNPSKGKATISIPVPEKYAGRTDFVVMLNGSQRVNFTVSDGKIIFSSDKFGTFDIYVKSGVSVKTLPSKTSYFYKETFEISGLELEFIAENGEKQTVTDTSKMKVTGFDSKKIGSQKLTVEYEGMTATFNVTVSYAWWQMIIRILLLGFLWY